MTVTGSTARSRPLGSAAHLLRSEQVLHDLAGQRAATDKENGIDFETGIPTGSMSEVQSAYEVSAGKLAEVQVEERGDAASDVKAAQKRQTILTAWSDYEHIPVTVPSPAWLPVRFLQAVVLAALYAEARLLVGPINEILRAGIGLTVEATSAALILTGLGALMAHVRGVAVLRCESASSVSERAAAVVEANRATIGLLLVASAAVLARVYAAVLAQGGIEPAGLTFFIVAQLVFLFAALSLPKAIIDARRRINRLHLQKARDKAAEEVSDAEMWVEQLGEIHVAQQQQLFAIAVSAHWTYLTELADGHPDGYIGDLLRARNSQIHRLGVLRALVANEPLPLLPGDAGHGDPGGGASGGPAGGGASGGPGGGASGGPGGGASGGPAGGGASGGPGGGPGSSEPRTAGPGPRSAPRPPQTGYSQDDLLNDILGRAS